MERLSLTGVNKHKAPDALSNLSAVLIDREGVRIDNAAIHGKSKVERGISWVSDTDDIPEPKRVALVWVTLHREILGLGIHGLAASIFYVDPEAGVGYKNLADQVNKMDAAVKGKIQLEMLTEDEMKQLGAFLMAQREELWVNATEMVWANWLTEEQYMPMKQKRLEAEKDRERIRLEAERENAKGMNEQK
ncbi:YwhD family protein [Ferroacidibacillus organovorans]|uniref:YwhD family protein n=1 Tax=Ferroacidibacillus organovorans TaxID=1765683 RepID=A0A124IVY7_9BACL|nr:YwhD family protein [Ferroacidibacillus organovorans]KUO95761.1 hypothetical protein ATW55_05370 [Ferroacidibacillus organovorans]